SSSAHGSHRQITFRRDKASNGKVIFDFVVDGKGAGPQVNPLVSKSLRHFGFHPRSNHESEGADRHLVLCFGGMEAHREANRHWFGHDFILPGHEELAFDETSTLVPFSLVRTQMLERFELLKRGMALLSREVHEPKWFVFSPPPCRGNDRLRLTLSRIKAFPADKQDLPSPGLRLKLWLLTKGLLEKICTETDHSFIDVWEAGRSPDGFLSADYEHDGMHANARYGRDMARRIVETIVGDCDSDSGLVEVTPD
ncbi:MAG: hypothetical protein MI865_01225, partial [Proteobacteria bacterium]|nr:hypothetical protein [Pseudomonadota bacterium]